MSTELHWRGSSRFHNWLDSDKAIPKQIVTQTQKAGLIGTIEWMELGFNNKQIKFDSQEDAMEKLFTQKTKRGDLYHIATGGSLPFKWKMTLGLFPFNEDLNQVQGYNIVNFWFDSALFQGTEGSNKLAQAFQNIHTIDNTEYASLHPYSRSQELTDFAQGGKYAHPVTLGPMFAGVYWLNFLGKKHLEFFDLRKLRDIDFYKVKWIDKNGLYLRVSETIEESILPETEQEMFRLTEQFKNAFI